MKHNSFTSVYFDVLPATEHKQLLGVVHDYCTAANITYEVVIESVGLTYLYMRHEPPVTAMHHLQTLSTLTGMQFSVADMTIYPRAKPNVAPK